MNNQIPGEGGMNDQFPGRTEMRKKPDPTLLKTCAFFRASVVFIARKRGLNDQLPGNGRNGRPIPRSKRNEQPNPPGKRNGRPFPSCSTYVYVFEIFGLLCVFGLLCRAGVKRRRKKTDSQAGPLTLTLDRVSRACRSG